ncbi:type II toxin-antitoxin system HicB family antitoxin [Thomasclavelia ramosa]|uniref:type II toxin-antitoxin system HicB family antitoxin n=1 Tax=Thomasclavelia ramosa TaxID=1547 RepID=UPI0034A11117
MEYKDCDYEIKLFTIETTDGIEYAAEIPELKGCAGSGKSFGEALAEVLENKEIYLETLKELGREIPLPKKAKQSNYSGRLSLRLSSRLHQKVSEVSDECGVSINQFIIETLAEAVGSNMKLISMSKEKMKQQEEIVLKGRGYDFEDNSLVYKKFGGLN